jgi:starch synthase
VLTIHTLGYQGWSPGEWLGRLPVGAERWDAGGACNPLLGGIRSADRVVAVSPSYAAEITTPEGGMGLDRELAARGDALVGILNGIDTAVWDPGADPHLPAPYGPADLDGKRAARSALADRCGWPADHQAIVGVVSRLVDQKGIDWVLDVVPLLDALPARLVVLGSGQSGLTAAVRAAADARPDRVHAVTDRFDEPLAHLIFGGADLFLMPSRFEPCGLAQMQAMRYGTIPIVTPVGGLRDTVLDDDRTPDGGTGFVAVSTDPVGVVDAVHRAHRACRTAARRRRLQQRGMAVDWSWDGPAARHVELYRHLLG